MADPSAQPEEHAIGTTALPAATRRASGSSLLVRHGGKALLAALVLALLYLVTLVYAAGETMLAGAFLFTVALALWTYASAKTIALRYLFPGVAAAVIFVVLPMVYTVSIGFTNYSSTNLADVERARRFLLDEVAPGSGPAYAFTLHPDGPSFRIRLENQDDDKLVFVSDPLARRLPTTLEVATAAEDPTKAPLAEGLSLKDVIAQQNDLKALTLVLPDGTKLKMTSLRAFGTVQPIYKANPDGTLTNAADRTLVKPNFESGFFETAAGEKLTPGFRVNIGLDHYRRIFTDEKLREPFVRIFVWTVVFAALSVAFSAALGLLLAVLLNWESLRGRGVYRLLLFLPYAVPSFISILIFKGLFNQNLGEINLILNGLFGIRPQWFADEFLAKVMILAVNTWLGFPYMMVVCMGLIKAISSDLYEASAVAGAGPLTNFFQITAPLIIKPLTPLLISAFAFNFNNFVLIALLTNGRPDFIGTAVPAGATDILVSYTMRLAFQDSGQQFGLACAIATVIFFLVATITIVQMRFTKLAAENR